MIEITGDYMEGGGQILRTAIALSAITGKTCRIDKIRANRPNPGLQAQHLAAVNAVAQLCNAKVDAKIGSTTLTFEPHQIRGGHYDIDIGTAGAISLVLQSLILPSIHAEHSTTLTIKGGTHVNWSPSMDYMQHIFCDFMKKIGVDVFVEIKEYGFYPKGGGEVHVKIEPSKPNSISLIKRGDLKYIDVWSIASEDLKKAKVAERQVIGFEDVLKTVNKKVKYVKSMSPGSAFHAHVHFSNSKLGSSSIGERGVPAEKVGKDAATLLKKQIDSNACFDEYMADQILPFLAFAKEDSKISVAEITSHTLTNIWVIEKFLPVKFEVNEKEKTIEVKV